MERGGVLHLSTLKIMTLTVWSPIKLAFASTQLFFVVFFQLRRRRRRS
jgi:hypothetical protein